MASDLDGQQRVPRLVVLDVLVFPADRHAAIGRYSHWRGAT
jgi:hypothetical protein